MIRRRIRTRIRNALLRCGLEVNRAGREKLPPDLDADDISIIRAVRQYTLTSPERTAALIHAVEYVADRDIPGAIVECGVWRGGSMMAAALTLLRRRIAEPDLYLFDTFDGMSEPTCEDVDFYGNAASEFMRRQGKHEPGSIWVYAPLEGVQTALRSTGYNPAKLHFVQGKVEDTIPDRAPEQISVLRLDTDWYESTLHELRYLFPRLSPGGVIIIDDYGHWKGARKAVDEYFARPEDRILLQRIDYTGRIGVKL